MSNDRARRFSSSSRAKFVEWNVKNVTRGALVAMDTVVPQQCVRLEIKKPNRRAFTVTLDPDDAYEFREAIGHAIDAALGI